MSTRSVRVCDGCELAEDQAPLQNLVEGSDGLDYCPACVVDAGVFCVEAAKLLSRVFAELNDLRNAKYAHLKRLPHPSEIAFG